MQTLADVLAIAVGHHQAGRIHEAAAIYERIIAARPDYAPVWYYRGLTAAQAGDLADAARHLEQATRLQPDFAEAHGALGNVYKDLGQLAQARACFQRAAQLLPNSPEAHYNLGNIHHALGELKEAIWSYRRALGLRSDFVEAYSNLGVTLQIQGSLDESIACLRRALELRPDSVEALINLGNTYRLAVRLDEAVGCFREAMALSPERADANYNLGLTLQQQGRIDEAAGAYERALQLNPYLAQAYNNLGNVLREQGKLHQALGIYRRALELAPETAETHNNLGSALDELESLDEAIICFQRALALKPDYSEAYSNLAGVLKRQCRIDEAVAHYRRALDLAPRDSVIHVNFALAQLDQGRVEEAEATCRRALELSPDSAHAHYCHAIILLLQGNFEHGFREHEWRWQSTEWLRFCRESAARNFQRPLWNGALIAGKTILLHAEQGLGDTLQFIRYAPLVQRQDATVVVEVPRLLMKLLARSPGIDRLVARGDELPPFDVHAPLLSLPAIFKTTLDSIPADVPYLSADPALVALWRDKLAGYGGLRIGINWKGRSGQGIFRQRDVPVVHFAALASFAAMHLVSLQKDGGKDLAEATAPIIDWGDEVDTTNGAFMDTAAIMMNLDLVITSDTSVAHLAGALGVPVWVALPFAPDWRWLLNRSDSPWYPTMRLFRQQQPGDWAGVFHEMDGALRARLQA